MPQFINTNISALNAQRNLNKSQMAGHQAMQRLSSGLRINSAKDDAAGLAIASRMSSQITGLSQAARNANDGISMAATAEGTLGSISTNLQRIRELAIQSANSTNSASDRSSLNAESTQLVAEITRQATSAQFNGLNLLDGSFLSQNFQVGANSNQTISISSIADSRASNLGSNVLIADGTITGDALATNAGSTANVNAVAVADATAAFTISTANGGTSSKVLYAVNSGASTIAAAINTAAAANGVTATATNSATLSGISDVGVYTMGLFGGDTTALAAAAVPPTTASITARITDVNDLTNLVSAINGQQTATGITAAFTTSTSKSSITLSTADGRNIGINDFLNTTTPARTINFKGQTTPTATPAAVLGADANNDSSVATGTVKLTSNKGAITTTNAAATVFPVVGSNTSAFSAVSTLDLTTATGSQSAIDVVDAALAQVNASRGDLGAVSNRFDSVISNLQATSENVSASRSRIQDADFAAESAELSRSQVLQQAGTAMLAQANQSTQGVMALLR